MGDYSYIFQGSVELIYIIFADFCKFSLFLGMSQHFGSADFHWKPQDFRSFSQKTLDRDNCPCPQGVLLEGGSRRVPGSLLSDPLPEGHPVDRDSFSWLKTADFAETGLSHLVCPFFRESETTIKIKFTLFRGGWTGGQGGKLSKTLFFMGNVMTIKF